ncbi:Tryptophan aminotransferase-related protein, partial [Thalictrum thalictroides]
GDPLFLEPFWKQHAASSAVVVAGWHRMSYCFVGKSTIAAELEKCIRELHAVVGNAKTDGRYLIFGVGSTQLLNGAIYALSPEDSSSPASVVAAFPFYPVYKSATEFFDSVEFKWLGDASLLKNRSDSSGTSIEFVTSPNNPDGKFRKPVLTGPSAKTIYDHAYYWPHFSAITSAADEDLMIFTLSKLTGHAGSRFGWAFIKDEKVYTRMQRYMSLSTMDRSHDTQLRTLKLLKVVLKERGRKLFEFGYKTMRERWERLSKSFSSSKRFSLQKLEPQYCTYFKNVTGPSPAYAWIKCEREEDQDCTAVFRTANIIGRPGIVFFGGSRYVRLSLIKSQDDFELLLQRIHALISKESAAASSIYST